MIGKTEKINLDLIPVNKPSTIEYLDGEYHIKTDGPKDLSKHQGSYLVLRADGSVYRRTLDAEGFIIHEVKIR